MTSSSKWSNFIEIICVDSINDGRTIAVYFLHISTCLSSRLHFEKDLIGQIIALPIGVTLSLV